MDKKICLVSDHDLTEAIRVVSQEAREWFNLEYRMRKGEVCGDTEFDPDGPYTVLLPHLKALLYAQMMRYTEAIMVDDGPIDWGDRATEFLRKLSRLERVESFEFEGTWNVCFKFSGGREFLMSIPDGSEIEHVSEVLLSFREGLRENPEL